MSQINIHLGQKSTYKNTYDPSLLVRELRSSNREYLNIFEKELPFVGYDTWNAYECSALLDSGLPISGVMKIVYPCHSPYIVESKSIKLYLNSFNMEKMGTDNKDLASNLFATTVASDLSDLLGTHVEAVFTPSYIVDISPVNISSEWGIEEFKLLDVLGVKVVDYSETPSLLKGKKTKTSKAQKFRSSLLKSNCKVTSQPDWGDVFIHYKGCVEIDEKSLLKYIISFRDECHFHEEICECIYKRLYDVFKPDELMVMCLYARRGGIDICPIRASDRTLLHPSLVNPNNIHVKTSKQ